MIGRYLRIKITIRKGKVKIDFEEIGLKEKDNQDSRVKVEQFWDFSILEETKSPLDFKVSIEK